MLSTKTTDEVLAQDAATLRPFAEPEVAQAMGRLIVSPIMEKIRQSYFPTRTPAELAQLGSEVVGWHSFQERFIAPAIDAILAQSSAGFTISGFERIRRDRKYVFVSNHRDIVCDPALFTYGLHRQGWESPLICLGDNLLVNSWIVDLVKMNRGVTVKRGLSPRELLRWSQVLSFLVRQSVAKNEASVWIAQREGRAKDGKDQTHPGILKMLALSGEGEILDLLGAIHLVPVAVSYEFDPCDALKARELYLTETQGSYQKEPGEDVKSMGLGIQGMKGRIHIEIGEELSGAVAFARQLGTRKEQLQHLARAIDQQIHTHYRNFPSAYIARDLLRGTHAGGTEGHYSSAELTGFEARLERQLSSIGYGVGGASSVQPDARVGIRRKILEMYSRSLASLDSPTQLA